MRPITEARRRWKCKTEIHDKISKIVIKAVTPPLKNKHFSTSERIHWAIEELTTLCEDYADREEYERLREGYQNGWLDWIEDPQAWPKSYEEWKFGKDPVGGLI